MSSAVIVQVRSLDQRCVVLARGSECERWWIEASKRAIPTTCANASVTSQQGTVYEQAISIRRSSTGRQRRGWHEMMTWVYQSLAVLLVTWVLLLPPS